MDFRTLSSKVTHTDPWCVQSNLSGEPAGLLLNTVRLFRQHRESDPITSQTGWAAQNTSSYTHTHPHAHIHTHTPTHAHTHTLTHTHTHTHTHRHTHTNTHTHTHTHT